MKASTPTSEIPRWPKTEATLNEDGSGSFTLNGRTEQLHSDSTEDARAIVLERVAEFADGLGRAVRLTTTDPDGEWELAVHPNGDVDELAARPRETRPTRRAAATAAVSARRTTGRRTVPRLLALLAFLAVAGAFAVLAITTLGGDDPAGPTPVRADTAVRTTAQPAATRTPAAVNAEQLALRAAQAGRARRARATAARKKAAAAQRSAAAHKRAVARRVARRKTVRKRRVARRVARRNAAARRAAARRRASTPQRFTPSPTPSPSPPQSTPPPTPQPRPTPKKKSGGGEFDF